MGNRRVHAEAKKHTTLPSPALTLERSHLLQRNPEENDRETIQAKSCRCSGQASTLPPVGHSFGRVSAQGFSVPRIQAKLTIGQPNDRYEQEADRVADQVMRMPEPKIQRVCPECKEELQRQPMVDEEQKEEEETLQTKPIVETITPLIQRQTEPMGEEEKQEEETLQTKPASSETSTVSSTLQNQITALQGGGQPLPESERHFFEPRFGTDFSQVRVHTGVQAAEAARAVNARAFTLGRDVVFGTGEYQPRSLEGQRLLAHELTHVVQQTGRVQMKPKAPPNPCTRTILAEGTCEHLVKRASGRCCDPDKGIENLKKDKDVEGKSCPDKKFTPMFTCDTNCKKALEKGCDDTDNWMAIPKNQFSRSKCGEIFTICANGKRTTGYVRDKSETPDKFEVSPGIQSALGVSGSFKGSVWRPGASPDKIDADPCCN